MQKNIASKLSDKKYPDIICIHFCIVQRSENTDQEVRSKKWNILSEKNYSTQSKFVKKVYKNNKKIGSVCCLLIIKKSLFNSINSMKVW